MSKQRSSHLRKFHFKSELKAANSAGDAMTVLPLLQRPFDCLVVAFLVSHIPITVLFDSQALFPAHYYPDFAQRASEWYLADLKDPLV